MFVRGGIVSLTHNIDRANQRRTQVHLLHNDHVERTGWVPCIGDEAQKLDYNGQISHPNSLGGGWVIGIGTSLVGHMLFSKWTTLNPLSSTIKAFRVVKLTPISIDQTSCIWGLGTTPYWPWPPTHRLLSPRQNYKVLETDLFMFLYFKRTCLLHELQHIQL